MKKYLLFLLPILVLIALIGCSHPNYYRNKGVFYFEKPPKELLAYLPFRNPDQLTMTAPRAVVIDSVLILPSHASSGKAQDPLKSRNVVYAIDTNSYTVKDSLVLDIAELHSGIVPPAFGQDLYLAYLQGGKSDEKMTLLKTDKALKVQATYHFNITTMTIKELVIDSANIYVLTLATDKSFSLTTINMKTMQLVDTVPVSKTALAATIDNGFVYAIEKKSNNIDVKKYDVANVKSEPVITSFPVSITSEKSDADNFFKLNVSGEKVFLSFRKKLDIKKGNGIFTIIEMNLKDKSHYLADFKGMSWDILPGQDKIVLFKSVFKPTYKMFGHYQVLAVSECKTDLTGEKDLLSYFPSEWNFVSKAAFLTGNRIAMIGTFQYISTKTGYNINSPFVAFYQLD